MSLKTLFASRTGKFFLIFIPFVVIIVAAAFFLFSKKGIKREHLVTVALFPDSTKSQEVGFNDEIKINVPASTIEQPDSLRIYRVSNTTGPDENAQEMKVYDLEMLEQNNFNKEVSIQIPYDKTKLDPNELVIKQVLAMYFNTEKNYWEPVDAVLNEEKGVVTINTNHFSRFALFTNKYLKKEPQMTLNDFICIPENLNQLPSLETTDRILNNYGNTKQYSKECLTTGYGAISDYYGFTSAFATLSEHYGGYEWGKEFNELTGKLGLYLSLGQYVIDAMNGDEFKGRANLFKNLTIYALGEYMGLATQIAFVGVFFIDYSLNKFGEAVYEKEYEKIEKDYKYFNQHDNPHFDKCSYANFIENLMKTCKTPDEMNAKINEEINQYVNFWWKNENVHNEYASEQVREKLTENAKREIVAKLRLAYSEVQLRIKKERRSQLTGMRIKIRDFLNSGLYFRINVIGEQEEIKNLNVRIKVKEEQEKWEGKTNEGGFWQFKCSRLGFLAYEFPDIVELEYDGKVLTQPIKFDARGNADITFKLPQKKKEIQSDEFDIQGSYEGTYTCEPQCTSGKINIEIDASGNTILTAEGSGGCTYKDFKTKNVQKFSLSCNEPNFDKKRGCYHISLKGTEILTTTYINAYETKTITHTWDDRNHGIDVYEDGTIKNNEPYLKVQAKK